MGSRTISPSPNSAPTSKKMPHYGFTFWPRRSISGPRKRKPIMATTMPRIPSTFDSARWVGGLSRKSWWVCCWATHSRSSRSGRAGSRGSPIRTSSVLPSLSKRADWPELRAAWPRPRTSVHRNEYQTNRGRDLKYLAGRREAAGLGINAEHDHVVGVLIRSEQVLAARIDRKIARLLALCGYGFYQLERALGVVDCEHGDRVGSAV